MKRQEISQEKTNYKNGNSRTKKSQYLELKKKKTNKVDLQQNREEKVNGIEIN